MDSWCQRALEYLVEEKRIEEDVRFPIRTIDHLLRLGLVEASEPFRKFYYNPGRWLMVRNITLSELGKSCTE